MLDSFTIFGAPARKSDSRQFIPKLKRLVLGKSAQQYQAIFDKQIERLNLKVKNLTDPNLLWVFYIYYNNKSADVSIELVFDFMQKHGVIQDDVIIRDYIVFGGIWDYELPRTTIKIYKLKE